MQLIPGWELKLSCANSFTVIMFALTMQLIPGWELKQSLIPTLQQRRGPYNAANSRMGIETRGERFFQSIQPPYNAANSRMGIETNRLCRRQ